ncbi:CRAL/TRIO domain-containing protein [Marasmius fiardii PR-910]|nr:CRAL/TRIO domain-containing protein [Marasmius fiardii PR-910]
MSEHVYEPFPPPKGFNVSPLPDLTPEQEKMQKEVQAHFSKDGYVIPDADNEKGKLMEEEKFWLSYECQLRYLRATKWKVSQAVQRLESTLKWRREYGLYTHITPTHVEREAVTGKAILFGFDVNGRPAFYMIPSRQNTESVAFTFMLLLDQGFPHSSFNVALRENPRQLEYTVWLLERCIDLMDTNVETIDLLINFADKAKNPSMKTSRTFLSILQDHYPERLGKALIINVPYFITMFFKLITPFIDPVTVKKLYFNPNVVKDGIFSPDMVMKEWWGGNQDFEWNHEKYWPKLVEICEQRKARWMENWRKLGGSVGISEANYKGEDVASHSVANNEKTTDLGVTSALPVAQAA